MALEEMKKRKHEEYEMQLFGFHSRTVCATLKSLIQDKIQSRCQKLCDSLVKEYKPDGDDIHILQRNGRKLMRAYYLGYKSQSSAIENCINKLITIPEYILLNEDKIQANQYTNADFNEMNKKLENLQQRLKKAIIFNTILKTEWDIVKEFEKNIDVGNITCDVIESGTKYPDINNIMIKFLTFSEEFQKNFDQSNKINAVKNKKRCLKFAEKTNNIDLI